MTTAAANQADPAVSFGAGTYLAVWGDDRAGLTDIYGTRVSTGGGVLDAKGVLVSGGPTEQHRIDVAFDGTNYLVVWDDNRNGTHDIYATRVSPAGAVLDPAGIAVSVQPHDQNFPAVAFDGTNYLVVWEDYRAGGLADIFASRLSKAGAVLDPNGIAVSTAAFTQGKPDVAFDGTNYLLAWIDDHLHGGDFDIFGARVSPTGTVQAGSPFAISTAANNQDVPAVAHASGNSLVVWHDARNDGGLDIYGTRVNTAGSVLDGPTGTGGIHVSGGDGDRFEPAVAASGADFFVAWTYRGPSTNGLDIYATRVRGSDGAVLDPAGIPISTAASDQDQAAIGLRDQYLVLWRDRRSGLYNIRGTRVSTAGVVQDNPDLAVAPNGVFDEAGPAVASNATSNWGVIYERNHVRWHGRLLPHGRTQVGLDTLETPRIWVDRPEYVR